MPLNRLTMDGCIPRRITKHSSDNRAWYFRDGLKGMTGSARHSRNRKYIAPLNAYSNSFASRHNLLRNISCRLEIVRDSRD